MRLGMTRRRRFSVLLPIIAAILITIFLLNTAAKRLNPVFTAQAHSYANTMVTDAIEKTVAEVLENGDYSETSSVNENGSVISYSSDTAKINRLKSELTVKIQKEVTENCAGKIYIPLGSLSGLYILSGAGPKIPVSVYPAAIVNTNYTESFESVGINQVRHSVAVNIDVQMRYSGYLLDECEIINTDVPVIETVITGTVPQYYGGQTGILAE